MGDAVFLTSPYSRRPELLAWLSSYYLMMPSLVNWDKLVTAESLKCTFPPSFN